MPRPSPGCGAGASGALVQDRGQFHMADAEQALLPAPRIDVDALPYIDSQYNNPRMKAQVDALIEAELKTFRPSRDYLERWPLYEPNFEVRQGPDIPRSAPRTPCHPLPPPSMSSAHQFVSKSDECMQFGYEEYITNVCQKGPCGDNVPMESNC